MDYDDRVIFFFKCLKKKNTIKSKYGRSALPHKLLFKSLMEILNLKHLITGISHMWQMAFSLSLMNSFFLSAGAVQGRGEAFAFEIFLKQGCMCLTFALIKLFLNLKSRLI